MRLARKLMLLALMGLAAAAVAAPSASATEPITVTNAAGANCSNLAGGQCVVHVTQEAGEQFELGAQIPFLGYVHQTNCDMEYDLNINGAGVGSISNLNISNCSSSMGPCNSTPWPAAGEEVAPGVTQLEAQVCITTPWGNCSGDFVVNIAVDPDTGAPNLEGRSANRAPIGTSICRVTGHWTMEGTDIRIVH
jgi:putative hemolysin